MRALITGGTGKLGAAVAERLRNEGWQVVAAGSRDGDLSRARRCEGARRASGRRARGPGRRHQRCVVRVRAEAIRGRVGGGRGRRARSDRQGELLRHAGGRTAPAREQWARGHGGGRRGVPAVALVRGPLCGEGSAGDADARARASARARGAGLRRRPGNGRSGAGAWKSAEQPRPCSTASARPTT